MFYKNAGPPHSLLEYTTAVDQCERTEMDINKALQQQQQQAFSLLTKFNLEFEEQKPVRWKTPGCFGFPTQTVSSN